MDRMHLKISDCTYLIDTREKTPLDIASLGAQIATATLTTGDYSIRGLEISDAVVERKSLQDLLQSITHDRERFERELQRMRAYDSKCVVVEATWAEISKGDWRNQINPSVVHGSCQRYMGWGIPFFFAQDRAEAAKFVANFLWLCARANWDKMRQFRESLRVSQQET